MIQEKAAILGRRQLSPGVYKYLLSSPGIARTAAAGQFVQVTAPGFFLRRPISICRIDPQAGTLVLVMEVRGNGTAAIAQLGSEDSLDLIGPLGSGFALKDSSAKALMVGGGIGLPHLCQPALSLSFLPMTAAQAITAWLPIWSRNICSRKPSRLFMPAAPCLC